MNIKKIFILLMFLLSNIPNLLFSIDFNLVGIDYNKDIILLNFSQNISNLENLTFNFTDESKKKEELSFKENGSISYILLMSKKEYLNFINYTKDNKSMCYIFTNNKNTLGHYGLKKDENFELIQNNISLFNSKNYSKPKLNLSLCFEKNLSKNNHSINIFQNNSFEKYLIRNNTLLNFSNSSNSIETNLTINISKKINYGFKIISKEIYEDEPIKFSFQLNNSNLSNFTILYYIENSNNKIVKFKRNSSNLDYKSFTPKEKGSQIYYIIARLYLNKTEVNSSKKKVYYFSKNKEEGKENIKNEIKIINQETIIKDKKIILEISRNETNKRVVNIFLNSKKILTIEPDKNTKTKLIYHIKESGLKEENSLRIIGLGINKLIKFNLSHKNMNNLSKEVFNEGKNSNQKEKKKIQLQNLSILNISNSNIYFSLKLLNQEIYNISCYILNKKTLVSKRIEFSNLSNINYNLSLKINTSILKTNISELKLLCKYFKKSQVSKKYLSKNFNFTKKQVKSTNTSIKNLTIYNSSTKLRNNNTRMLELKKLNLINLSKTKYNLKLSELNPASLVNQQNSQIKQELIFKGKEEELKENSINLILGGISVLGLILLIFW